MYMLKNSEEDRSDHTEDEFPIHPDVALIRTLGEDLLNQPFLDVGFRRVVAAGTGAAYLTIGLYETAREVASPHPDHADCRLVVALANLALDRDVEMARARVLDYLNEDPRIAVLIRGRGIRGTAS